MEDDVAAEAGGDQGGEVGDVTVCDLQRIRIRRRDGEGGEVAGAAYEGPHGVALGQQGAAQAAA